MGVGKRRGRNSGKGLRFAGALEAVEVDFAEGLEAEPVVDADGLVVGGEDVQDGAGGEAALVVEDVGGEGGGEALAAVVGVGADGADLAGGVEDEALAGHGEEMAGLGGVPDAEVAAHEAGAGAEEAGEGDVGEGDHGGRVGAGEGGDGEGGVGDGEGSGFGEGHLEAGEEAAVEEGAGVGGRDVAKEVGSFAGGHEGVEVAEGGWGVFGEAGEGGDVRRVFAGEVVGEGEVLMGGVEGVCDGVGEGVVGCGVVG